MTIKQGQIVGWVWNRKVLVCVVHSIDKHDYAQIVTEKCLNSGGGGELATAFAYDFNLIPVDYVNRHGDVILSKDKAEEVGTKIRAFLETKRGQAMLEKPKREKAGAPEKGRGKLQRSDIPDRLAKGFSSALSTSFEARIGDGGARTWSLGCLKNRNEPMYHVYVDRETYGYSFKEIAVRRNVTENNARQIYHRARIDLRELHHFYPVAMKTERIQAAAA